MKKEHRLTHRIGSAILALILAFGVITITPPVKAEAAGGTLVTDAVILTRIHELNSKLGGTYWNKTHSRAACGPKCSGHGCSKCSNATVIKQTWFKNMFKFKNDLSTSQFPKTYTIKSYIYHSAESYAGFANITE